MGFFGLFGLLYGVLRRVTRFRAHPDAARLFCLHAIEEPVRYLSLVIIAVCAGRIAAALEAPL